jgi:phenylpropionate dioxygenase-like ring-hydroxylating dioxygenase large terminal subunit
VNLDGAAARLAGPFRDGGGPVAAFRLPEMKLVVAREWDCPFNWKALVENFMESYHHLGIHHKTLQPMMPARTPGRRERRRYVRAHLPYKDSWRRSTGEFEERGDFSGRPPAGARA